MKLDLSVHDRPGHASGAVYQFADGMWPGEIVGGIVIHEAAFDFVEPCIKAAWPKWDGIRRYGVTEITAQSALDLAVALEGAAKRSSTASSPPEWLGSSGLCTPLEMLREFERFPQRYDEVAKLFRLVAAWLREASERPCQHCLLGI
jgi:hypothetical protein